MGAISIPTLRAAIRKREFTPVYVLHGEDEFRKDAIVRELVAGALDPATRDFNLDTVRGGETTAEAIGSLLQTPPMMAARRLIIVRDVAALKKESRSALERYLRNPAPDTTLVLMVSAGTRNDVPTDASVTTVAVNPLTGEELPKWVDEHIAVLGGAGITKGARARLRETVSASTSQLASELDKLVSYVAGGMIDEAAVIHVVGERESGTLSEFLDHVAKREAVNALAMIDHVLGQPKTTLVSVVMALTVQTLAISWGRHARDRGLPAHQLESEYFRLLKATGSFPMRPWGEAVRAWSRNVSRWDAPSLRRALAALRESDQSAKDTRFSSDEQLLSTLVCRLCATDAREAA